MNCEELIDYYANLLILQYLGKPKAFATIETLANPVIICQLDNTIQTLSFDGVPASGNFSLAYGATISISINWNASNDDIFAAINDVVSPSTVISVTGSLASQNLIIQLTNTASTELLTVNSNTLMTSAPAAIAVSISGNVDQGPLALSVQNAFNLVGPSPATGVQLDVLGKYAGVSRNVYSFSGPVTLDDSDFLSFIQMAIAQNGAGSSLADIENLLNTFFPGVFLVYDYANMHMDYWFSAAIGSRILAEAFVTGGRLPKPMGVQLGVTIYVPDVHRVFGFRTYTTEAINSTPFNSYTDYDTDTHWLSYKDGIV